MLINQYIYELDMVISILSKTSVHNLVPVLHLWNRSSDLKAERDYFF